MDLKEISFRRLANQQISASKFETAGELVGWLGAVQAQDYPMSKLALGVRLPGSTERSVEAVLNSGEVLRTHVMRPTWHLVSATDIYWLLELTAPQVMSATGPRHRDLGLTGEVLKKSAGVIEKALRGDRHLTRDGLVRELENAGIPTGENRASHLLAHAELEGLICSGAVLNGKITYALLDERVPRKTSLTREEALARLAGKYFFSRGPATLEDFTWWSGLPVFAVRQALELVKADLVSETVESQTYWFDEAASFKEPGSDSVYLLPAFDEFLISYADRHAPLPYENYADMVSSNGIFRPIIVVNGRAIGVWKRTIKKDNLLLEIQYFTPPGAAQDLVEEKALQLGRFLEKKVVINPAGGITPLGSKLK